MADPSDPAPRPTLSDVLGALATSLSHARVQADIAAAEIANVYREHELLRGLPIPRIRLNRVRVSLPFVVTDVSRERPGQLETPAEIARLVTQDLRTQIRLNRDLVKEVDELLDNSHVVDPESEAGVAMRELARTLNDVLNALQTSVNAEKTGAYWKFPEMFTDALTLVMQPYTDGRRGDDFTSELDVSRSCSLAIEQALKKRIAIRRAVVHRKHTKAEDADPEATADEFGRLEACYPLLLGEKAPDIDLDQPAAEKLYGRLLGAVHDMTASLSRNAGRYAIKLRSEPPQVEITVDSATVKAQATPGTLTRVTMVMSEEGLEWSTEVDDGGKVDWKLIPE